MIVAMHAPIALFLSALLLAFPASVRADDCVPLLESAWVRQPPMAMPMMAGFVQIRNPCASAVTVVSASSPSFGSVELHETTRVDGVSRMRHIKALEVPAGATATLAPGGLHLMLMQPRATPVLGESLEIELALADGRRLRAGFEVRAANAL